MIKETLDFFATELNAFLTAKYQASKNVVTVTTLTNAEGKQNNSAKNKIVLSLLNVMEEKSVAGKTPTYAQANNRVVGRVSPPIDINLYLLFAANYKDSTYDEGLKLLYGVIGYFQMNRIFQRSSFPNLVEGLDRFTMELMNYELDGLNNLWGMQGGSYVPSVIYRLRSIRYRKARSSGMWSLSPSCGLICNH